jgi:P4 family phage/plasmid primase-like protien
MSSFAIEPFSDSIFSRERLSQIKSAIFIFYDYTNDRRGLEDHQKRCCIFDYDDSRVVLLFPLIIERDMGGFESFCKHYGSEFKFLGEGVNEDEMCLCPSSLFPPSSMCMSAEKFLGCGGEYMIQDFTISHLLDISSGESEEDYVKVRYENMCKKLEELLSSSNSVGPKCEDIISDILYECIVDIVTYYERDWWIFEDGLWRSGANNSLWMIVSKHFKEFLFGEVYRNESMVNGLIDYMGSVSSRLRVLKDLSLKLSDGFFVDKLDSKRGLVRVLNGTLNVRTGKLRESLPSDYFSLSCGVRYLEYIHESETQELLDILRQIFPTEEVLRFFVRSCSSILEGFNKNKVFYVWWGRGNNGKTLLQRFITSIFGDYCITLSSSLITGRRAASSEATPDVQYSQNRLVVFLQEPNPEERIQVGRMKELTGNDRIYKRELYKPGSSMEFKAKMVIVANNAMEVPNMDAAFRKRMVVIPFESTFTNSPRGDFQFPIDVDMEEKMFKYREAFLNLLVREYEEFDKEKLYIPRYVRETTEQYITINNYSLKYIQNYISEDEGNDVLVADLYSSFKEWFKEGYPGRRIPPISDFVLEVSNADYCVDGRMVKDVKII